MRHLRQGFTLVELMTVIALALVVLGLGAPALGRIVAENQRIAASNAVLGLVQYARAEAIKHGRDVVLCPALTDEDCAPTPEGWSAGFIVFVDDPPGRPYVLTDLRLRLRADRWPARVWIQGNRDEFVFRPVARRSTNGTIVVCHPHPAVTPRAVIVAPTGRPRVSRRLADGREIPCPEQ